MPNGQGKVTRPLQAMEHRVLDTFSTTASHLKLEKSVDGFDIYCFTLERLIVLK